MFKIISADEKTRIQNESLAELDGADLEWKLFGISHSELWIHAFKNGKGEAEVVFGMTSYIRCPTQLHNVQIRTATPDEHGKFLGTLGPGLKHSPLEHEVFSVISSEGDFTIWAEGVGVHWGGTYLQDHLARWGSSLEQLNERPLWPGGPSFQSL